jgi:hypothetical protein
MKETDTQSRIPHLKKEDKNNLVIQNERHNVVNGYREKERERERKRERECGR